jgi:hypothetical protein
MGKIPPRRYTWFLPVPVRIVTEDVDFVSCREPIFPNFRGLARVDEKLARNKNPSHVTGFPTPQKLSHVKVFVVVLSLREKRCGGGKNATLVRHQP